MSKSDPLFIIRKTLLESLGDKAPEYLRLMKLWFRMKMTKDQFDCESRKFLTTDQVHLHNQIILLLLNKCFGLAVPNENIDYNAKRKKIPSYLISRYEPLEPTMVKTQPKKEVKVDPPPYMTHERLLPDHSFMLARLLFNAWELGLDDASPATADLLVIATQNFLKNIITAVLSQRKGCKFTKNKFLHAIREPVPNPWLKNFKTEEEEFHGLTIDPESESILVPTPRPTEEVMDRNIAYRLSASECSEFVSSVTMYDILTALKVYPKLVCSNFVSTVNKERIISKLNHPSWED